MEAELVELCKDGIIDVDALRKQALGESLKDSHLRSVHWRLFVGCLPADANQWRAGLKSTRDEYMRQKSELQAHPNSTSGDTDDLLLNNPLSQAEDSPWSQFFEDNELCDTIKLDLDRTYAEDEFFSSTEAQTMMLDVLFVWCKRHPDISYRQGMNELLAPLLLVMHQDAKKASSCSTSNKLLSLVLDEQFTEHDTYAVFCEVMDYMAQFFATKDVKRYRSINKDAAFDSNETDLPVIAKCKYIQRTLLLRMDPVLSKHLDKHGVEPQIYGLRWVRLFFSREFHISDVLIVWDGIFGAHVPSSDLSFDLVDYLCCACLLFIRQQLIDRESHFVLQRVMRYPPVEDVRVLVHEAWKMKQDPKYCYSPPKPTPPLTSTPTHSRRVTPSGPSQPKPSAHQPKPRPRSTLHSQPQPQSSHVVRRKRGAPISRSSTPSAHRPAAKPQTHTRPRPRPASAKPRVDPTVVKLEQQVEQLSALTHDMGSRLEAIVLRLQRQVLEGEEHSHQEQPDTLLNALAQMKQIKEVLLGRLDSSDCHWVDDPTESAAALEGKAPVLHARSGDLEQFDEDI